jgi:hypothetical protein
MLIQFKKFNIYLCLFCREDSEDDVYCFGCIILEVLMGPKLHGKGSPFVLNDLVKISLHILGFKFLDVILAQDLFGVE